MRFPVGTHWRSPFDMKTNTGILKYFHPMFEYVQKVVNEGKNVLIHCIAGAHRAGTTGVSWLMFSEGLNATNATRKAKQIRPVIDPTGSFENLLN